MRRKRRDAGGIPRTRDCPFRTLQGDGHVLRPPMQSPRDDLEGGRAQKAFFLTFWIPESLGFGCSGPPPPVRLFSNAFLIVSLQLIFAAGLAAFLAEAAFFFGVVIVDSVLRSKRMAEL